MARLLLRRAAGLVAGCALLLSANPALASTGVAVDLGRIEITEQLSPGGSYNLPTIGVRNPGTERTTYAMVANPVIDPSRVAPPKEWFHFEPTTVTLEPGESEPVRVRLVLPTNASPADYIVLVGAQIQSSGQGASVGAAAAARTTFTIRPANGLQAVATWFVQTFSDLLPWSAIVPSVIGVGLVLWLVRRRFRFGLRIERR
jgi:hypothetical protein